MPSWGTSCWSSPQPQTTGCSTACLEALPIRACGGTACLASATCRLTALVSGIYLPGPLKLRFGFAGGTAALQSTYPRLIDFHQQNKLHQSNHNAHVNMLTWTQRQCKNVTNNVKFEYLLNTKCGRDIFAHTHTELDKIKI